MHRPWALDLISRRQLEFTGGRPYLNPKHDHFGTGPGLYLYPLPGGDIVCRTSSHSNQNA